MYGHGHYFVYLYLTNQGGLQLSTRTAQFLILQVQFHLIHLQFVEQIRFALEDFVSPSDQASLREAYRA